MRSAFDVPVRTHPAARSLPDSNRPAWTGAISADHAPYMQRLVVAAGCRLPAAIPFTSENVFDVCAEIPE